MTDGLQTTVHLNGVQIKQIKEFKYLRQMIQENSQQVQTHFKIGQATTAFVSLKCTWGTKPEHIHQDQWWFQETLTLVKSDLNKLQVFPV